MAAQDGPDPESHDKNRDGRDQGGVLPGKHSQYGSDHQGGNRIANVGTQGMHRQSVASVIGIAFRKKGNRSRVPGVVGSADDRDHQCQGDDTPSQGGSPECQCPEGQGTALNQHPFPGDVRQCSAGEVGQKGSQVKDRNEDSRVGVADLKGFLDPGEKQVKGCGDPMGGTMSNSHHQRRTLLGPGKPRPALDART